MELFNTRRLKPAATNFKDWFLMKIGYEIIYFGEFFGSRKL